VRLSLSADGGFAALPGLRRPLTVDVDVLPAHEASQVRQLLDAAGFFALPARLAAPPGASDYREYTLTAENGDRHHTVKFPEIGAPPELLQLVDLLSGHR
jgi:Emfourin